MSGARVMMLLALALLACGRPGAAAAAEVPSMRVLDTFDDLAAWTAGGSDGVRASVHPAAGPRGPALRLDFDLGGTAGYAIARRTLPLELPRRYELVFSLRADAPVNHFQVKLVDASGDNVWWVNRPDFEFPGEWQPMRIKQRHIQFAWGPTADRTLRRVAAIEFVVAAGRGGGRGSVYVSDLALRELPDEPPVASPPLVRASSALPGADAARALDGAPATAWKSDAAAGRAQTLTVDFQRPRELGGLMVRWLAGAHATRYDVELSDDGAHWRTVRRVVGARGGPDAVWLPEAETRFLRLALQDGPQASYGLAELEVKDLAFGASINTFFQALARDAPRGTYPRGMSGEQTAWTVVGVDGAADSGLLSEDGALEVGTGAFSIEPFVVDGSRVISWADVETDQSLVDGYLPIPGVTWRRPGWELRVTAFASGAREASRLVARYELRNLTDRTLPLRLVLAVRPFQVNPPSQSLNLAGGASAIRHLAWAGGALSVNAERTVWPLRPPDGVGAFRFDEGAVPALLGAPDRPRTTAVRDELGYASAALEYQVTLEPHARESVGVVVPLTGPPVPPALDGASATAWMAGEEASVAAAWRERLNRVGIELPESGRPLIGALRTAVAHMLVMRDGPVLRPGTRSYARSWIRDGAMMAESFLRVGHAGVAADYLRWYARQQFSNGKVPCCIDARGIDPVPEHDSPGQLIFLAAELYRYTQDRQLLEAMWPRVEAAARYMESLRQSERTEANLAPATRAFYGLLPASISHEGYSAKPMHSYWDNFWALKGYTGAIALATALGRHAEASRLERQREEFRTDLAASLRHAIAAHGIDYLPGCAELGDFDPTSSTIALAPGGEAPRVPRALLTQTFERYWREFVARRDGQKAWEDYTPYEIRTIGTFVRLGWRDRAHALLDFFLAGRRPVGWNQWPEVVGRDPRQPRFIGDMPHGWVASDFIRAALDLFVYEREDDAALVLAAGVRPEWLEGNGVTVTDVRTPYGPLGYSLRREGERVVLELPAGAPRPPGGLVLAWPGTQPAPRAVRVNGKPVTWQGAELRIRELPATVVIGPE